jgi:hypothetical protein
MKRFPDRREGDLSRARAALVSESGLAQVALAIDLGRFILLGKGEERTGGRSRPSILANALDALVGAIYIDAGFDAVAAVAARLFEARLEDVDSHAKLDFKSRLQERAQALWQTAPVYEVSPRDSRSRRAVRARGLGGTPRPRRGRSKKPNKARGAALRPRAEKARQGEGVELIAIPRTCWSAAGYGAGHEAHLVGAGARHTAGRPPADFDVATDAVPEAAGAVRQNFAVPTGLKHARSRCSPTPRRRAMWR